MPRSTRRRIAPSDVAAQFEWDIGELREFAGDMLEDANDHDLAAVIRALNRGDFELAKDWLVFLIKRQAYGGTTPSLRIAWESLMRRDEASRGFPQI